MCGIAGILRITPASQAAAIGAHTRPLNQAIPEAWLDILDESIKHRGPDGQGRFRDRAVRADGSVVDVALVHRRLSIIDHAGGAQPMVWPPLPEGGGRGVGSEGSVDAAAPSFGTPSLSAGATVSLPSPLLFHGRPNDPVVYSALPGASGRADRVAVVFNGCIYNHRELRKELQAAGHEFVTDHSDTEVLVHGWREWGATMFGRLVCMGAIVVWCSKIGGVVLHRTLPGEKPLYWGDSSERSWRVWSSVPHGVARIPLPGGTNQIDRVCLTNWIAFGHKAVDTPYKGINQPGFGYAACFARDEVKKIEAPHLPPLADRVRGAIREDLRKSFRVPGKQRRSTDEWVSTVESLLHQSVSARLEADVPIACFLSGGVDSSLVASIAAKSCDRLRTLCVRMPSTAYDESTFAEGVAQRIGSTHRTIDVGGNPAEDLVRLITTIGLPFGDSSLLPTFWVCKAAADEAGVALSGDGADELFYGYERYLAADRLRWAGIPAWFVAVSRLDRRDPKGDGDRAARFLLAARSNSYASLLAIFQRPDLRRLVGWLRAGDPGWDVPPRPSATSARNADLMRALQGDMLRKVDSASMIAHIEVRCPFLDQLLVNEMWDLDAKSAMPNGQRKGLLRQVARKYLPAEIVDRPKMGFAIPIGEWFRSDYGGLRTLLYDRLSSREPFGPDSLGINSMINMDFVRRMLKEHDDAGKRSLFPWKGRDHSQRLYMLLVLSIWADWLGGVQSGTAANRQSGK